MATPKLEYRDGTANHHPAVVAASATLAPVRERYEQALKRDNDIARLLSPTIDHASVDVLARLDAMANRERARLELLAAERDLEVAQRAVDTAREVAREDMAHAFQPTLREAVDRLKVALLAARDANSDVQRVQLAQHEQTGRPFDPVSVVTLNALVDDWQMRVKAAGFDV